MKKSLFKFLLRKITKNLSGFITISIIVALGVGFLVGLLVTTSDLQSTVDAQYDSMKIADITLKSTVGFDDSCIETLNNNFGDNIEYIQGYYQMDEHAYYDNERLAARTIYYDFDEKNINLIELEEGRKPEAENEVVVETKTQFFKEIHVDETIIIDEIEYKVVGIAANPQYFSNEKEFTTISPGRLDTIVYFNEEFNSNDFYTDIAIKIKGSNEYDTFSDEYNAFIDEKVKLIDSFKSTLIENRIISLKLTIEEEVRKAVYEELVNSLGQSLADVLIDSEAVKQEIQTIVDEQISNLDGEVYILDRLDNTSFYMYKIQSNKTNEIAIVFPFFFIAIAGLITLSTLERMIKEDRIYIGTLKSLGYKKRDISGVYILYSAIAGMSGVILGTAVGIVGLPFVIYIIFSTLFRLPPMVFNINLPVFLISTVGIMAAILLATVLTLLKPLKEKPNALLTQKPIKSGGKIVLERFTFLWKRLKFKYKSTFRNLFRFKKNALLMIVGVAGSTALVLGAFGMSDSISDVTGKQYSEIISYNTLITVNDYENDPLEGYENVVMKNIIYKLDGTAVDDEDFDIEIIAPYSNTNLNDYINFIENGKKIEFNEDSIFISSQLSSMLGIEKDDVFFFEVGGKQYTCLVNGIVENHISNYIYLSENIFKNTFKNKYEPNCFMAVVEGIEETDAQDRFITELTDDKNVISVNLTYQNKALYENLLGMLQLVVVVLIFFAGALEITSIYSLTNINVSERTREIATLKVLGYRRSEVVGYIYRETTILAVVGTLIGFLIGFLFHRFVVSMMQFAGLSIGYVISPLSYLYAFIISLLFFGLVDLIFLRKIDNLSMVESLKSVE